MNPHDSGITPSDRVGRRLGALALVALAAAVVGLGACDELVTEVVEVTVAGHPTAEFAIAAGFTDSGCVPMTVNFVDKSDGPRDGWVWSFGDGDSASTQDASHIYDSAGVYTVSLKITDSKSGGVDIETKTRFIIVGTIAFSFATDIDTVCPGTPITFTPSFAGVTSFQWKFGDGAGSNDTTPSHAYSAPGEYPVTLTVNGACGVDSFVDTVTVITCPSVTFASQNNTDSCAPHTVTFIDQSAPDSGAAIDMRIWDYGDGQVDTFDQSTTIVPHTFADPGVYSIMLTITTTSGGVGSFMRDSFVTVSDPVTAGFTAKNSPTGCFNPSQQFLVHFEDTSLGNVIERYWDFGDGTYDSTNNPAPLHAFDTGNYTVTLTVVGTCGLDQDTSSVTTPNFVWLSTGPIQSGSVTITEDINDPSGLTLIFQDNSTGEILSRLWNFNDGVSMLNQASVSHAFSDTGSFQFVLTDSNNCGAVIILDTTLAVPIN
ncbi:MAG TPA: PKD domain-containing protein [candidate division Zixibacteria bacterium]|nr:PKD domain-containing protein [candidate division Zixibacteria bacterium]